jgi:hypothetical protein
VPASGALRALRRTPARCPARRRADLLVVRAVGARVDMPAVLLDDAPDGVVGQ